MRDWSATRGEKSTLSRDEISRSSGNQVLLVDDNPAFLDMVYRMLVNHGYQVTKAANGIEAVQLFLACPADLVITDLIMPERGGLELLQELKNSYSYLKLIAVSGGPGGNTAWLPIAKRLGALRTLKKPFRQEALLDAVREVLRQDIYCV